MKISIIVPAYNVEAYLPRCLDSILAQTYENLEVVVVNDGSRDGTASVIDNYAAKDSRIKAIHKENGGVTSARLCGVEHATGEWIGFCDGDDFVEPDMYSRLLKNALDNGADISHCGYKMIFPSGKIDYYYNTGKTILQPAGQGCTDLLEGAFIEPGLVNKIFDRKLFFGLNEWMDRSVRINEDLLMNFYLFRQAKQAFYEDFCPYRYILRKGSAATSRLNEHKLRDPITVLHRLLVETEGNACWNAIVERRLIYQLVNSATISAADQKGLIVPFRREARKELRSRVRSVVFKKKIGTKLKIMALWAAVWPWSYNVVHKIYAHVRGTDKKFDIT